MFEAEPRKFLDIDQVFTNEDLPTLISLGTNGSIPVISATEAVLYRRNEGFEWRPAQTVPLEPADAFWSSGRDEWSMGANPAYHLGVRQSFRAKRNKSAEQPENEAIRKILEGMKKTISPRLVGTNHFDVNGDGRKDAIFWQFFPGLDPKTDIYLFLRGADGKLPDRPTQILHCRGFPIPVGSTHPPFSPVARLKNDGAYQVVLVELATTMTSASSLLDMALSGGLECALTIRSFNGATFSGNPDATIPIRTIMPIVTFAPVEDLNYELFFLCGDFNADGRPDLIVKRATSQWSIFFSTADGRWFAPQPAATFDTQMQGNFEIKDLNGDGRSDIILRAWDDARIFVGVSQAKP